MKYIFGIAVFAAIIMAGWETLEPDITNAVFQDEVRDAAAQLGWRVGLAQPRSDEELRNLVILNAARHDISLSPKQVTVRHNGTGEYTTWYIAVDYTVRVNLVVFSFGEYFNPTSKGDGKFWARLSR